VYVVILAGGGGTRLRPLSTTERPKPFLPLTGDQTLFQRTVARVRDLDIFCVADARYSGLIASQAPGVRHVAEPAARNTAPAIALAVAAIERPDDEVMVVLPADHSIRDEAAFRSVLTDAESELARGAPDLGVERPLVTLGVRPDRPATEYGYLRPDRARTQRGRLTAYALAAFEEKPHRERAQELLREEGVAWNAGMFLWQRRAIRDALSAYTDVLAPIEAGLAGGEDALARAYSEVTSISIDYAVMEPAARDGRVVMGAMDVGWNDLGSWSDLLAAVGLPPVEARVLVAGEPADVRADDLLVERRNGRLVAVPPARDGTMTAYDTTALLRGARPHQARVDELLARCTSTEGA
jgi:mannose-1-phosphate guanylyltransferase